MRILKIKTIELDDESVIIDLGPESAGSVAANQICFQVDEECDLIVKGKVVDDCDFEQIALIQLADLSVVEQITAPGIYLGEVNTLTAIEFEGTGTAVIKILVE